MNLLASRSVILLAAVFLPVSACYSQGTLIYVQPSGNPPPVMNNNSTSDQYKRSVQRSEWKGSPRRGHPQPPSHGDVGANSSDQASISMPPLTVLLNSNDVPEVVKDRLRGGLFWEWWQTRMGACLRDSLSYRVAFESSVRDYEALLRERSEAETLLSKENYLKSEAKDIDHWLENHERIVMPLNNSWVKFKEQDTIGPALKKIDNSAKIATRLANALPAVSETTRELLREIKGFTGSPSEAYNWTVDGVGIGLGVANIQAMGKSVVGINNTVAQDSDSFDLGGYRHRIARDQQALSDEYARLHEQATRLETQECPALEKRYLELRREYDAKNPVKTR